MAIITLPRAVTRATMDNRQRHQHSTAVFVVLQRDSRLCMLRRTGTGWLDGYFSLPAGGLEPSETIRMAAIREAREEVGVELDPHHLRHAHTLHNLTGGRDWVGHFFTATVWTGTPRICEPDRHGDLGWHSLQTLPEPTIPYVRQALRCIGEGLAYSEFGWPA